MRVASATLLVVAVLLMMAGPAYAHVELAASTPADGDRLDTSVDVIELTFTDASELAGDGIVLLSEAGGAVSATVQQSGDAEFTVTPDQPLMEGAFAVSWTVRSGDAHPRSGVVTFAVTSTASGSAGSLGGPSGGGAPGGTPSTAPPEAFASLVGAPDTSVADWMGRLGRGLGLLGALIGIGAVVFAAATPVASIGEARSIGFWVRRAGFTVLASAPIDLTAQAALLENGSLLEGLRIESLAAALAGPFGWAILLRIAGGAAMLWGTRLATSAVRLDYLPDPTHPASRRDSPPGLATLTAPRAEHRLDLAASPLAVAGSVALVIAFLFDGHTVTVSPVWLTRLTDLLHVAAAATWMGGVAMLAMILTRRKREGRPLEAGPLVFRFSAAASVALSAVGIAGVILAWVILDSVGELFTTPWGRTLIAKLAAVAVAAALGAYNHFVVVPRLADTDSDEGASDLIRRTVRIESATLVVVVALTAILVGAAS